LKKSNLEEAWHDLSARHKAEAKEFMIKIDKGHITSEEVYAFVKRQQSEAEKLRREMEKN
jgi:hypothetical protein